MRLLAEHTRTYSVAHSKFVCTKVDLSTFTYPASKRDLYLRAFQDPAQAGHTGAHIYAFKDLDHALNFPGTSGFPYTSTARTTWGVVAYAEDQTLTGSSQSITLTDNAGVSPDVTGLAVTVNGAGDASTAWNAVYAYTASPSSLVLGEIVYLLGQRMSAGQILEDFEPAWIVQGPEDLAITSAAPNVVAAISGEAEAVHTNDAYALTVEFAILVGCASLEAAHYTVPMRCAGSVRSLLMDEEYDLNLGVTDPVAHVEVVIGEVIGPQPVEGEAAIYLAARLNGRVTFPLLRTDRS